MTECKLWQRLIDHHPAWGGERRVTLTPATLRRLVALTWREATREALDAHGSGGGPVVDYIMGALKKST